MDKSNKKRLLYLIEILKKQSDYNKHLKIDEIISLLEDKGIAINNRKTLYDDFKVLNELNINVEYDNGYYLIDAPFNLSEIKIIIDSINSLKNLDTKLLNSLSEKLYTFISNDEVKYLEKLKYSLKHKDSKLLMHMENILEAINKNVSISIKTKKDSDKKDVFPIFLHRENDYYYFYYHYPNSDKIYHYRFDNIKDVYINENDLDTINISRNKIISHISESSNSFNTGKTELVNLIVLNNNEYLNDLIMDDFDNAIKTKDGFCIKINPNSVFYSKLVKYGNNIKIKEKDIAQKYSQYLKSIIELY